MSPARLRKGRCGVGAGKCSLPARLLNERSASAQNISLIAIKLENVNGFFSWLPKYGNGAIQMKGKCCNTARVLLGEITDNLKCWIYSSCFSLFGLCLKIKTSECENFLCPFLVLYQTKPNKTKIQCNDGRMYFCSISSADKIKVCVCWGGGGWVKVTETKHLHPTLTHTIHLHIPSIYLPIILSCYHTHPHFRFHL